MSLVPTNSLWQRHRSLITDLGCLIAMTLVALLMFRRALFTGEALYFRDFQLFFAPMKQLLTASLSAGKLPLWNPYVQMGIPFLADPQSGVFYPPSLLFLLFDTARGMAATLAFHLVIAQAGFYLLARYYGFGRISSLAGALAYGLGGWMISSGNMMTLSHSAAWVPWTILTFERMWLAPRAGTVAVAAVILALQMLSGWPEMFLMIGLVLLVRRLSLPSLMEPRWLLASVLACLVAVGLFAPQGLTTWEAFGLSDRVGGMSENLLFEFSSTAGQWRSLLFPPPFATDNWNVLNVFPDGHVPNCLSMYLGWTALVLVLAGLFGPRKHLLVWLCVVACGVFIALGNANPFAMSLLRLVNIFRSPEKYLFLVHFGACMLLVAGCARLLSLFPGRLYKVMGVAILLGLAGELTVVNGRINLFAPPGYYDLAQIEEARILKSAPGRVYAVTRAASRIEEVRDLYAAFRQLLTPNLGSLDQIGYFNGISFLNFREHELANVIIDLPPSETFARRLGFFGVSYLISDDPGFASSQEWKQFATQLTPTLWRLKESAPYLGFPGQVVAATDGAVIGVSSQAEFARGEAAFVPPEYAFAGENLAGEVYPEGASPGHVAAKVKTLTGGLVVLRESAYPGWRVSVDGQAAQLIQCNRFFLGVIVPAGEHRVSFDYVPTYWKLSLALAATAALVLLSLAYVSVRGRRSRA